MRLALAVLMLCCAQTALAHGPVERFAVIIGNNRGAPGDVPLRYAETDATRVHDVLLELGDFVALGLGIQVDLGSGLYSGLSLAGQTHFLRLIDRAQPEGRLAVGFAVRAALAFGKQF